jgi:hypothetical protein
MKLSFIGSFCIKLSFTYDLALPVRYTAKFDDVDISKLNHAVIRATVLAVVAKAIACASHKRILSAYKITSFIDFGEAPLHYMSIFDEQIQTDKISANTQRYKQLLFL